MNRIIILVSTVLLTFSSCNYKEKKAEEEHEKDVKKSTLIEKGQDVPKFEYINLQGDTLNIRDHQGKVVFMNFFATSCPICIKELPYLEKEIQKKYKNNENFELLVFGREHNVDEMSAFKEQKGYTMNFIPDPERKIYALFAEKYIPRNIVLNREGKIIYEATGFTEKEFSTLKQVIGQELNK
ncbi:MAG: TlpA disulfide reductase family protein [Bacteroidota bacterium]|nr:TlpA disulfide reductase family protein [Bacteroidota bacterium]